MSMAICGFCNRTKTAVALGFIAIFLFSPPLAAQTNSLPEWGTRAQLIEPNSEMAVAHLGGRIYVVGGYPKTRVSVDTVQVYDVKSDSWHLTTAYPTTVSYTHLTLPTTPYV